MKRKMNEYKNEYKYELNCPSIIKDRKQFVCWKFEDYGMKKIPYNANSIYDKNKLWECRAKSNDEATWGTFDEACESVKIHGYDGIGIMLGKSLIGIDLDDVVVDGKPNDKALDIIKIANSYTEYSPSKKGIHILLFGELDPNLRKRYGDIEIYQSSRFFTLTGDVFEDNFKMCNKKQGIEALKKIYDKYIPKAEVKSKIDISSDIETLGLGYNLSNQEIIRKLIAQGEKRKKELFCYDYKKKKTTNNKYYGINLEKELLEGNGVNNWENCILSKYYKTQSHADFSLLGKILYYTNDVKQVDEIFRQSGLMREKWDKKIGEKTYGQLSIEKAMSSSNRKTYNVKRKRKEIKH